MEVRTQLSVEMSNEEYTGLVARVVRRIAEHCKEAGTFDLSQHKEEDIEDLGAALVQTVMVGLFSDQVKVKPPF